MYIVYPRRSHRTSTIINHLKTPNLSSSHYLQRLRWVVHDGACRLVMDNVGRQALLEICGVVDYSRKFVDANGRRFSFRLRPPLRQDEFAMWQKAIHAIYTLLARAPGAKNMLQLPITENGGLLVERHWNARRKVGQELVSFIE